MTQGAQPTPPVPPAPVSGPPAPSTDPKEIDLWQSARGVIQHEDGLVHNRLTWFLSIQGFFFAAFGLGFVNMMGAAAQAKTIPGLLILAPLWLLFFLIVYLGIKSAKFIQASLDEARKQNERVTDWWNAQPAALRSKFPQVRGDRIEPSYPENLPKEFLYAWKVLGCVAGAVLVAYFIYFVAVVTTEALPWTPTSASADGAQGKPPAEGPSGGREGELKREMHELRAEVGELKRALTSQTSQMKALQEKWEKQQPAPGKDEGGKGKG